MRTFIVFTVGGEFWATKGGCCTQSVIMNNLRLTMTT